MLATIAPGSTSFEESLSTLRYADRAKQIVNHAIVNEASETLSVLVETQTVEALSVSSNANRTLGQPRTARRSEECPLFPLTPTPNTHHHHHTLAQTHSDE